MRRLSHTAVAVVACAALLSGGGGCYQGLIIRDPITREADGWWMTLEYLRDDGSTMWGTGDTLYRAHGGERFLVAYMEIRNYAPVPRVFSYDACDVDLGPNKILPALVSRYNGISTVLPKNEPYDPGERSYRMLIFSYPKNLRPRRIQCGYVTYPVPGYPAAAPQ